ncbi:MAG TPA: hypothetical protein VFW77_01285 [Candidatus Saccharimonadales bacterium]|nr:hypothetical protein [Candidatus Saccharimonadales bacterium]
MTGAEAASAYELAEKLHSSLYNDPANRARGLITDGEVRADISEMSGTERLTTIGEIAGRRVYQHLSRSRKTGAFYLSTVFTEPGGEVMLKKITENSPPEVIAVVAETLFMQSIGRAAETG